jgi:hypothetical protein
MHVPDSRRASLKYIIIKNDVPVYWLLLGSSDFTGPAATGIVNKGAYKTWKKRPAWGNLMRPPTTPPAHQKGRAQHEPH